jgi:hypothetical protein
MFSSQSSGAVNAVVNNAVNVVSNVASGAANAATSIFNSVNNAANDAAKNIPLFNSLIPIGNTSSGPSSTNTNKQNNKSTNANKPANNGNNANMFNNIGENLNKNANSNKNVGANSVSWVNPLYVFAGIVVIFLIIFSVFNAQIRQGYEYVTASIKMALNYPVDPDVVAPVQPVLPDTEVTVAPEAPQDITPSEQALPQPSQQTFVEKLLPPSGQEVFNVAQNKFTYYDAEPLCNALGAELATYEQVKDAWGNGADWCNYGWVKGQMAVYPTQKETYDKLQSGPVDERNACGTVGINGGYFDNPEFKYGVNCYGKKPSQSAHDQEQLMMEGKAPKSPETLKVDKMVAEYKDQADSLFVKPFNDEKWASS